MALSAMSADGAVPDWIHLLPAGLVTTQDGRGPYKVPSIPALAEALNAGGKLALDECHSTDLAAPSGAPAPARGWMTEFEAREDGLWALVKWTAQGRALMEDEAYNGISPVIVHTKDNTVVGLLRASLTNAPNLRGLTALHSQDNQEDTSMDWKAKLMGLLGLPEDADDAAIEAALEKKLAAPAAHAQQQDITEHPAFKALQSELTEVTTQLNAQTESTARDKATAFVDAAIAEGRVGVKPARDEYVQMHMEDPARAEKLIGAMPILKGGTALQSEIAPSTDESGLDAEDRRIMALMGVDEEEYKASRDGAAQKKEAL
jgi:phage I-like protein